MKRLNKMILHIYAIMHMVLYKITIDALWVRKLFYTKMYHFIGRRFYMVAIIANLNVANYYAGRFGEWIVT